MVPGCVEGSYRVTSLGVIVGADNSARAQTAEGVLPGLQCLPVGGLVTDSPPGCLWWGGVSPQLLGPDR